MRRVRQPAITVTQVPATATHPALELRVSTKRVKSATASWRAGVLVISLPAHLNGKQRQEMVDSLVERALSKRRIRHGSDETLLERALELAPGFIGEVQPTSVRFVSNQRTRWGSCSFETGEIRITDRLRGAPQYVLDAVLIHELCHLVEPNHSARFQALVADMPRRKEAEAFLAGMELGLQLQQQGEGDLLA